MVLPVRIVLAAGCAVTSTVVASGTLPELSGASVMSWQQISNTLSTYCYALDSKDFSILEDVFTSDAVAYFPAPLNTMNGVAAIESDLKWDLENITTQHLL